MNGYDDFGDGLGGQGDSDYFDSRDPELIGMEDPSSSADLAEDLTEAWLQAKEAGSLSSLSSNASPAELAELTVRMKEQQQDSVDKERAIRALGITGQNQGIGIGGQTARTAQMVRFQAMSYGVQQQVVDMINDPDLVGTKINTADIYAGSVSDAIKTFSGVIGSSSQDFARELSKGIPEGTVASRHNVDVATAFSMLGKTSGSFSEAGSDIYAGSFNTEKQLEQDEDLQWALGKVREFAAQPIDGSTSAVVRADALKRNEAFLMDRFMNVKGKGARIIDPATGLTTMDDKGNPIYQSTAVPLPIEFPGMGAVQNANIYGGKQGSGMTHEGYEALFPAYDKDADGNLIFDLGKWQGSEAFKFAEADRAKGGKFTSITGMAPSARQSYYPTKEFGAEQSSALYGELKGDYKKVGKILTRYATTLQDEYYGNATRSKGQGGIDPERIRRGELYEEAITMGMTHEEILMPTPSLDGRTYNEQRMGDDLGTGSDRAGKYGESGLSEIQAYVEAGMEAGPAEAIYSDTDQGRYLARVAMQNNPQQGTAEWLAQREGTVTASQVRAGLVRDNNKTSVEALARSLRGEKGPIVKSDAMALGNKYEEQVKRNFINVSRERGLDVTVEESFFETSESFPGFGVSPDGNVFDKNGKSQGLAEFKYLQSRESMDKSLKSYTAQMQLQMAITGEDQVHFFRQLAGTDEYKYDVVKADKEYQRKLIKGGRAALALASGGDMQPMKSSAEQVEDNKEIARKEAATVYSEVGTKGNDPATVFSMDSPMGADAKAAGDATQVMYRKMFDEAEAKRVSGDKLTELKSLDYTGHKKDNKRESMHAEAVTQNEAHDAKMKSQADKESAKSAKELSQAFKAASSAAKKFGKSVLNVLGGAIDSQTDIEKLALSTGTDAENVWGFINEAGQSGMLTQEESGQVLTGAQSTLASLADPTSGGAQLYANLQASLGQGGGTALPDLPSLSEQSSMSFAQTIFKATTGMNQNDTRKVMEMAGVGKLFTARQAGMDASAFDKVSTFDSIQAQDAFSGKQLAQKTLVKGEIDAFSAARGAGASSEGIALAEEAAKSPVETAIKGLFGYMGDIFSSEEGLDKIKPDNMTGSVDRNPINLEVNTTIDKDGNTDVTVTQDGKVSAQESNKANNLGTGGR